MKGTQVNRRGALLHVSYCTLSRKCLLSESLKSEALFVEVSAGGSEFHVLGAVAANERPPSVRWRLKGTSRDDAEAERRRERPL